MSEQEQPVDDQEPIAEDAPVESGGSSLLSKIKIGAIVAVIVVVECSAAWFFIPSATATNQSVQERLEDQVPSVDEIDAEGEQGGGAGREEVELGEFDGTSTAAGADTTLIFRFNLYGTIDKEDKDAFDERLKEHEHRIRGEVHTIMREAQTADLADPGLGLIKRKILDRINHELGEPYLKDIIFSEFQFYTQ